MRRLIRKILIPFEDLNEDFDLHAWHKKLYGPHITVVTATGVPDGWVLVDGIYLVSCLANRRCTPPSAKS